MGVTYGRITIREQKNPLGKLHQRRKPEFQLAADLRPGKVLDYVVVHELSHRKEMNHSPAFMRWWHLMPEYKACEKMAQGQRSDPVAEPVSVKLRLSLLSPSYTSRSEAPR